MAQVVFERNELKYVLDGDTCAALSAALQSRLIPDRYGQYTISSIYFDTKDYQLIRTSLEKPVYKEKFRLRSYGVPGPEDSVFLELKKKYRGVIYKRRAVLSLAEADQYLLHGKQPAEQTQILREIDWTVRRYSLQPKVLLAYDRKAFYVEAQPDLRVTFDHDIRWRRTALDLSAGDQGQLLLESGMVLMEIKIPGAMPLWLSHMLAEFAVFPTSFSKYGTCYKKILLENHNRKAGKICA